LLTWSGDWVEDESFLSQKQIYTWFSWIWPRFQDLWLSHIWLAFYSPTVRRAQALRVYTLSDSSPPFPCLPWKTIEKWLLSQPKEFSSSTQKSQKQRNTEKKEEFWRNPLWFSSETKSKDERNKLKFNESSDKENERMRGRVQKSNLAWSDVQKDRETVWRWKEKVSNLKIYNSNKETKQESFSN
jgi:rRNA maturation protein Nop10